MGAREPHRPYSVGERRAAGIQLSSVTLPPHFPDTPEARGDLADYYAQVQRFDQQIGSLVKSLKQRGELDSTIFVVTSDNGMPFPRAKATLYDLGTQAPLAIRWGNAVPKNRRVSDFVSLCDLAPTFLEIAGLPIPKQMTGRSLLPILRSSKQGQVDPHREFVLTGLERHCFSYPSRALRDASHLFIRNYAPND